MKRILATLAFTAAASTTLAAAERLVTLGGPVTEIVFALGEGDQVVAVDQSSTHPEAATELPQVGYVRALSAEGVLSVNPDHILAASSIGPAAAAQQLESSGISFTLVPNPHDAATLRQAIRLVGRELDRTDEATALIDELDADLEAAKEFWAGRKRPQVVFIMGNSGVAMAAGAGTQAAGILELAGGENIFTNYEGYKPVSEEALLEKRPDAILVGSFGMGESRDPREVLRSLGMPNLAGIETLPVKSLDVADYLSFGPRTGKAALRLAKMLANEDGNNSGKDE